MTVPAKQAAPRSFERTGEHNFKLNADDVEKFRVQGFVGPFPRFADDQTLDKIHQRVSNIIAQHPPHPLYGHRPPGRFSVRDWHLASAMLYDFLTHPAVTGRVRSLAGDDLALWRSKIFHKSPHSAELDWHQEWGYFNGEEIGSDLPSLIPKSANTENNWNWSVWFALQDMSFELGPIRFIKGSHTKEYPWKHVPMDESAFFHSLDNLTDAQRVIAAARSNNLFLDVDTSSLFLGIEPETATLDDVKQKVREFLKTTPALRTLPV